MRKRHPDCGQQVVVLLLLCANCAISQCPQGAASCSNDETETIPTSLKALSMVVEEDHHTLPTTTLPSPASSDPLKEEPKGRALNFSVPGHHYDNGLAKSTKKEIDLSDVSMDEEEEIPKVVSSKDFSTNTTLGTSCTEGGLTYENGEKLEIGCDSLCTCTMGKMICTDRCSGMFLKKGQRVHDPLCTTKDTEDPCCLSLICSSDTETEPLEMCTYKNKTYNRGEKIIDGCESLCLCEVAGKVLCHPRCPQANRTSDRCVEVPDPSDSCCKKILCDVTLDDHEPEKEEETHKPKLLTAKYLNSTTVRLEFDDHIHDIPEVELSIDKMKWIEFMPDKNGFLKLPQDQFKYVKIKSGSDIVDIYKTSPTLKDSKKNCEYKGKNYKMGDEFNDNCTSICACQETGVKCLKLECPTYFGVDVLDPTCVEWETIPPNFVPSPPNCCPKEVKCKSNGSCIYEGETYQNWQQIPINVTGCERRCYCEMGKVECQNTCPPVPALPPNNLDCPPHQATLSHLAEDDCCTYWVCREEPGPEINTTEATDLSQPSFPFTPKTPTKILGPLLIYTNKDDHIHEEQLLTNITSDENHYFVPHKSSGQPVEAKGEHKKPLYPPPTPQIPFAPMPPKNRNPMHTNQPHQIEISGKGDADELLQFIHQHPELANYPSGSVFEVHDLPQGPKIPYGNANSALPPHPNLANSPYVLHPDHVNVEHLLQHIQKGPPSHQFPQFPPTAPQNGLFVTAQNGPVLHHQNLTPQPGSAYPEGLFPPGFAQPQNEIEVHNLVAIDAHTVRLAFTVPPIIVGLHGRFEVRYTYKNNEDPNTWQLQIFAPPNDLIATPQLNFDLVDLKEDKEYRIKITVTLQGLHNAPSSRVYTIRTLKDVPQTTLPPMIPIDPHLSITDVNATWANVAWRQFSDNELQFIDGVQLRYREIDGKLYAATPLIHRAVTSYTLETLKPNTMYEIGIYFIPFPHQTTELHAEKMLHFTTASEYDAYAFNVTLEIAHVKATSVEIGWSGVPYPEDKYVNIYRAIYQSDSGKGDYSNFKVAKRDSPPKTIITDLKSGIRYRLWLEVYLTNGRIKTSNVQDFITKPGSVPRLDASTQQGKLESGEYTEHKDDYYGALVVVGILAALAIMSTLILLLILVKRHTQNKAAITIPPRVSQSAYDNPTYKVEIQQETMDL